MLDLGRPSTAPDDGRPTRDGTYHGPGGIGCWFLDPDAQMPAEGGGVVPLGTDPCAPAGHRPHAGRVRPAALAWTAMRVPGGIEVRIGRARDFDAATARWRRRPWRTGHPVPVECLLARLERMRTVGHLVQGMARALADLAHQVPATLPLDRVPASAAAFLDGLDPVAREMAASPIAPPWGTYAGLDRTVDPAAPLAAAIAGRPALAWLLGSAWLTDPGSLAPDRIDGDLAHMASVMGGVPRAALRTVVAMHDAVWAMSPEERGTLQIALSLDHGGPVASPEHGNVIRVGAHANGYLPYPVPAGPTGRMALDLCRLTLDLHPNWLPTDVAGCLSLARSAHALAYAVRSARTYLDIPALVASGGKWAEYEAKVAAMPHGARARPNGAWLGDVSDALARQVLGPAMSLCDHPSHPDDAIRVRQAAAALLWSGMPLPRQVATSTRWHAVSGEIAARLMALPRRKGRPTSCWPAHLPGYGAEGMFLTVLETPEQLLSEGCRGRDADGMEGMAHCVAGYAGDCLDGTSRIASVREGAPDGWERLSTVEFGFEGGKVVVRQHSGRCNAEPEERERSFVDRYLAYVNGDRDAAWGKRPAPRTDMEHGAAGYDAAVPGNVEAAIALWEPLLPKRLRGRSPLDWYGLAAAVPSMATECNPMDGHWRAEAYAPAHAVGLGLPETPRRWPLRSRRVRAITAAWDGGRPTWHASETKT